MGIFRAGAAKKCITPPESMLPAVFHLGPSFEGIHDDLFVRALVLEDGCRRSAIITFDTADMSRSADLYRMLKREFDLEREYVMLAATHAHATPTFDMENESVRHDPERKAWAGKYGDLILEKTRECVREAIEKMKEAMIGYGEGTSYFNSCEDEMQENGIYAVGQDMGGPSDKTLGVVKVTDLIGTPIAILANYAVHGTFCYGGTDESGDHRLISGDFPGMVSAYVEERYKEEGTVCLWTSGAAGDQQPIYTSAFLSYRHDGYTEMNLSIGYAVWKLCERAAMVQGVEIIKAARRIAILSRTLKVSSVSRSVMLPGRTMTPPALGPGGYTPDKPYQGQESEGHDLELKLKLFTLNDIAILGMNAEIVVNIGKRLKNASPLRNFMIIEHTEERIHYLTDEEGYNAKTHAYFATRVRGGVAGDYMEPALLEMMEERLNG